MKHGRHKSQVKYISLLSRLSLGKVAETLTTTETNQGDHFQDQVIEFCEWAQQVQSNHRF